MHLSEALFLGILQGITEFLPVSSSGHLVIAETYLGLDVDSLKSFDVVVHLGTLTAVFIYFWKDIKGLFKAFLSFIGLCKMKNHKKKYQNLIIFLIIATVPAVIVGLLFEDAIDYLFRSTLYVGIWMIIVAEIFIIAESQLKKHKEEKKVGYVSALIIGMAQALALIPGVSRSGITISAGIFQGIPREKAARFSFLMAVPAIMGAGILTGIKEVKSGTFDIEFIILLAGFISSAAAGFLAIYFLMKFIKNHTLRVFSYYLFGIGIITIILSLI
jgi:undecaprenyl-diphosphatase